MFPGARLSSQTRLLEVLTRISSLTGEIRFYLNLSSHASCHILQLKNQWFKSQIHLEEERIGVFQSPI